MAKKFLDYNTGLPKLWSVIKSYVASVKTSLESSISDKQDKLVSGTSIKTVNGESVLGSGDITIDLSLYKVVDSLPTSGIDVNKIYLVKADSETAAAAGTTADLYKEYVYVSENEAWEQIGEYKTSIDLTPYAKKTEAVKSIAISGKTVTITMADGTTSTQTTQDTTYTAATTSEAGLMSASDKTKLDSIASGATEVTVDSDLSSTSTNPVQNKVINTALAGKQATLTAGANITISGSTISATNTDTKVTQNAASSSTTGSYSLLLANTAGSTAAETGAVNKAASLTYVQSTGTLSTKNVTADAAVTGAAIVKSGGTSDEILLADGTVAGIISEAEIEAICV